MKNIFEGENPRKALSNTEQKLYDKLEKTRDKLKKTNSSYANETDSKKQKALSMDVSILEKTLEKIKLDISIVQYKMRKLDYLESRNMNITSDLLFEEAEEPSKAELQKERTIAHQEMDQKLDDMEAKIQETKNKLKELNDQYVDADSENRKLIQKDIDITTKTIVKLELELQILQDTKDKMKLSESRVTLVNEDISGWGHRHIPHYRGVKTQFVSDEVYYTDIDLDDLDDDSIEELTKHNYKIFTNLSKAQKNEFYKEFNKLVAKHKTKHTNKSNEYNDDYEMIIALSQFGIELHSNKIEDSDNDDNDINKDGTVGDVMYDDMKDYVPTYGETDGE